MGAPEQPQAQPAECKILPPAIARTQLQALKLDIQAQSKSLDRTAYNLPQASVTPFFPTGKKFDDGLRDLVKDSLVKLGLTNVPPNFAIAVVSQLLNQLGTKRIYVYTVQNGDLVLGNDVNQELARYSILPWEALADNMVLREVFFQLYDLGKYEYGKTDATPKFVYPAYVQGSVDATWHINRARDAKWYTDKKNAAEQMMNIFNRPDTKNLFDALTQALIKANESMLNDLAGFDPAKIRPDFEKKYTKDQIFGPNGAYNIVLGFQRVLAAFEDFSPSGLANRKATLSINIGIGNDSQHERYTWVRELTCVPVAPPQQPQRPEGGGVDSPVVPIPD